MQYPLRINEAEIEQFTTCYVYTLGLDIIIWIEMYVIIIICYYYHSYWNLFV